MVQPLLTRRQTLQSLAFSTVFGGSILGLIGCGGGGHRGGGTATESAKVTVSLPAGLTIPSADLVGGTAYGSAAIANGSFAAKLSSAGLTFAFLQQKSTGKFVLFGLVGAGRPGVTPLASGALAVALALGLTGLPSKNVVQAIALLEADANVQALAATISTTLGSDPHALTNGNATITAAIEAAVDAIGGGAAPFSTRVVSRADPAPLILVTPSDAQGGARVDQGDTDQVVPTNLLRRPATAYTYRVGHVATDGTTTAVSPPTRIDQQDVEGTTALVGSLASLGAKASFAPVVGKGVELPIASGDARTLYETVFLMASGDASGDPAFFGEAQYAGELAGWRAQLETLSQRAFIGGILFDLFNSVLGGAATALSALGVAQIVADLEAIEASAQSNTLFLVRTGSYGAAAKYFLTQTTASDVVAIRYRSLILQILGDSAAAADSAAAGAAGTAILGLATFALGALLATGTLLLVADAASSYYDAVTSPKGERWQETVIVPSVAISPATANVPAGTSLSLTAGTPGISETNYKFHWTLSTGGNGNIGDPTGTGGSGRDITTTGTVVNLLTASSDVVGAIYTVTVEALDLKTGASLGKATSKLTVTAAPTAQRQTATYRTLAGAYANPDPQYPFYCFAAAQFTPVQGARIYGLLRQGPGETTPSPIGGGLLPSNLPIVREGTTFGNVFLYAGGEIPTQALLDKTKAEFDIEFAGYTFYVDAFFD